jgi:hypothetical protein
METHCVVTSEDGSKEEGKCEKYNWVVEAYVGHITDYT